MKRLFPSGGAASSFAQISFLLFQILPNLRHHRLCTLPPLFIGAIHARHIVFRSADVQLFFRIDDTEFSFGSQLMDHFLGPIVHHMTVPKAGRNLRIFVEEQSVKVIVPGGRLDVILRPSQHCDNPVVPLVPCVLHRNGITDAAIQQAVSIDMHRTGYHRHGCAGSHPLQRGIVQLRQILIYRLPGSGIGTHYDAFSCYYVR